MDRCPLDVIPIVLSYADTDTLFAMANYKRYQALAYSALAPIKDKHERWLTQGITDEDLYMGITISYPGVYRIGNYPIRETPQISYYTERYIMPPDVWSQMTSTIPIMIECNNVTVSLIFKTVELSSTVFIDTLPGKTAVLRGGTIRRPTGKRINIVGQGVSLDSVRVVDYISRDGDRAISIKRIPQPPRVRKPKYIEKQSKNRRG